LAYLIAVSAVFDVFWAMTVSRARTCELTREVTQNQRSKMTLGCC